jgi:hypothetical protein
MLADVAARGATDRNQQNLRDWHERLAGVRPLLPEHAVVGFMETDDVAGMCFTQYELAPVVVLPDPELDLVIATSARDTDPPPSPRHKLIFDDAEHRIMLWKAK